MRVSIIIAAHNEGHFLRRTLESIFNSLGSLDAEILVADDASTDGSVEYAQQLFPTVLFCRNSERLGASPTKALGAQTATSDILIFLDAHTKPEFSSLERLAQTVVDSKGSAIITPKVLALDVDNWWNDETASGHGYWVDLLTFDCGWLGLGALRKTVVGGRPLYASPSLIGCAFAISRKLYRGLWGFDRHMFSWGVEDLDLGLKCWLAGYQILHDPEAAVGHRFRDSFDNYQVSQEDLVANQLRMARKNFTESVWLQWVEAASSRHSFSVSEIAEGIWARAWLKFNQRKDSADQERASLHARRKRDEFWYAGNFGLSWPALLKHEIGARPSAPAPFGSPAPSPSPGVPKLILKQPTEGKTFAIDEAANPPEIVAEAQITGIVPDPTGSTTFDWTLQVTFDASVCNHGPARQINPPAINQSTVGGKLDLPLPWVRGGNLLITVSATVNGQSLKTTSKNLRIVGTNPPFASLQAALGNDASRCIARLESGCRQFDAAAGGGTSACPLWSGDNAGGVGVMQLTSPPPTDDEVWNWQSNVATGLGLLGNKAAIAQQYPARVRGSAGFAQMVAAFNANRVAAGQPPIQITLPGFTSTGFGVQVGQLGQVELDGIRGYNGWAGRDIFGFSLHEFRVAVDAAGFLVVNIEPGGMVGTVQWERVPAADRPQGVGDPDYVNHVLGQQPC